MIGIDEDADRLVREGALDAMQKARKAGKFRYLGFTGHKDPSVHLSMLEVATRNGFTFDAEDTGAIAEGIRRFAVLPNAERAAMGQRARAFAERELGFAVHVSAYERAIGP